MRDGGDDPNANKRDDKVRWWTKDGRMNDVGGGCGHGGDGRRKLDQMQDLFVS
jgi:hypothetical protein